MWFDKVNAIMTAVSERWDSVAREIYSLWSLTEIIEDTEANCYGSLLYWGFWLERPAYLDNSRYIHCVSSYVRALLPAEGM